MTTDRLTILELHERLQLRARLFQQIRSFFDTLGYVEVHTPLLVPSPGLEPQLVAEKAVDGRYLITSPEFHMKRLLVAGLPKIYSLGPCWRREEHGALHLNEFYMLEWYDVGLSLSDLMSQTQRLIQQVADALDVSSKLDFPSKAWPKFTVVELVKKFSGVDMTGVTDVVELQRRVRSAGIAIDSDQSLHFDELFSYLWIDRIDPNLATLAPAFFVYDFPIPLAALARRKDENPTVAERFELYMYGVELANAFGELTDPDEQLRRFESDQAERRALGRDVYNIDMKFIEALRKGMPACSGIALGVDRLLMVLLGLDTIDKTVAFPPSEI